MSLSTPLAPPVVANLPAPFLPASGDGNAEAGRFARELDQRMRDRAHEAQRPVDDERADGAGSSADTPEPEASQADRRTDKPAAFWPQGPRWGHPAGGATPAPGLPGAPETGPGLPVEALDRRPDGTVDPVDDPDVCFPTDPDCELPVSVLPDDAPAPASVPLPQAELGNWPQSWPGKGLENRPDLGRDGRFGARPTDPIRVPPGSPGSTSNAADTLGGTSAREAGSEQAKASRAASQAGAAAGMALTVAARAAQALVGRAADAPIAAAAAVGHEAHKLSASDATTGFVALGAAVGAGPAASAPAWGSGGVAGSPAEARLATRPGDPGFGAELGTQVSLFIRGGVQSARLMLNPAEMGPVQVQIQLDGKGARVHLAAEHPATRQALEQAMPQLAATLRESGLTLTGGGVSEQARSFGGETTAGNGGGEPGSERRFADGNDPSRVDAGDERLAAQANLAGAALREAGARTRGVVDLVA